MKLIFLNGPPRCGKDYAGETLARLLQPSRVCKLAKELKERCHAAYRLISKGRPLPHDFYEDRKELELPDFEGLTPRAAYIAFSENWIKPTHGEGQLGVWLADWIEKEKGIVGSEFTAIITDSGFVEEAEVLIHRFGADNCQLIRLHRKGYSFSGDSRSYIELGIRTADIVNCGGMSFSQQLEVAIRGQA